MWVQPLLAAKATQRVVSMFQKGELDARTAMVLLGQGLGMDAASPKDVESSDAKGTKRHHEHDGDQPSTELQDGDGAEDLDDILSQAKKAKMDTPSNLFIGVFFG